MDPVNRNSPIPLYEQLKLVVRDQIVSGSLPPGAQLPSEQAFCEMYKVSRITVTRALQDLEREGFINRIQGKGSIVIYPGRGPKSQDMESIKGFSANMVAQGGGVVRSKLLSIESFTSSPTVAGIFGLPGNQDHKMMRIRRLRYVGNKPAVLMTTIVRESVGLRMQEYDLETASFYQLYEKILGVPVIRNETELTPILASPEVVELLRVKPGSPHFLFHGTSYVEGEIPVELCVAVFHGEMFQFSTNIYRIQKNIGFNLASETARLVVG